MNEICRSLGCEFPLFAFSHCRDVVVEVSKAGGLGVLGGSSFTPEILEQELSWIDERIAGKPYGVDILIPENLGDVGDDISLDTLRSQVPQAQRAFTRDLLQRHGVNVSDSQLVQDEMPTIISDIGHRLLDVAFQHPIKIIVNALGIAPQSLIQRARQHQVLVGALVGAREHAIRQVEAGVDVIVAQGTEAAGHCGEVSTLVLVPEVIDAIADQRSVPVLAAGGIVTGKQMAACMALGAQGAWTGTVWLSTPQSEVSEAIKQKMFAASSRDTIRSTARTGKPSRQLHSAWHDAWHGPDSPGTLPMPLMSMLAEPAFTAIDRAIDKGDERATVLSSYWVGQGVGMVNSLKSCRSVVAEFKEDFGDAVLSMSALLEK
ncbi:MAG: nitronate monooxygenase family protein [Pseudomonadota bacterium]